MTLIPRIDETACLAHGDCAALAPDVLEVGDVAVVVGRGDDEAVLAAARACPAAAIVVVDADTGEQRYP